MTPEIFLMERQPSCARRESAARTIWWRSLKGTRDSAEAGGWHHAQPPVQRGIRCVTWASRERVSCRYGFSFEIHQGKGRPDNVGVLQQPCYVIVWSNEKCWWLSSARLFFCSVSMPMCLPLVSQDKLRNAERFLTGKQRFGAALADKLWKERA